MNMVKKAGILSRDEEMRDEGENSEMLELLR